MLRQLTEQDFYLTLDTYYVLINKFFHDLKFRERFSLDRTTTIRPSVYYRKGTSSCNHYEYSYTSQDGMDVLLKISRISPKWTTDVAVVLKNENEFHDFSCELNDVQYEDGLVFFERYFRHTENVFVSGAKVEVGLYEVHCQLVIKSELWEKICKTKQISLQDNSVLLLNTTN
jgi:hypothetical protein